MQKILKSITLICLCLTLSNCSVNPATGNPQFTGLVSDSQAKRMGREAHPKVLKRNKGLNHDNDLNNYVNKIGQKLLAVSEMADKDIRFHAVNDLDVNAFVYIGGYIYISQGLITMCNDEAELASVIAHEIGHTTARHSQSRETKMILLRAFNDAFYTHKGLTAAQLLIIGEKWFLMPAYSRKNEFQADLLAIRYLKAAGYDTEGAYRMFSQLDRMRKVTYLEKDADITKSGNTDLDATHPAPEKRMERALKLTAEDNNKGKIANRTKYLERLDDLHYGQLASQGFTVGQYYAHRGLNIKFYFPDEYMINQYHTNEAGIQQKNMTTLIAQKGKYDYWNKKREKSKRKSLVDRLFADQAYIKFKSTKYLGIKDPKEYLNDVFVVNAGYQKNLFWVDLGIEEDNYDDIIENIEIAGLKGAKMRFEHQISDFEKVPVTLISLYYPKKGKYINFEFYNTTFLDEKRVLRSLHIMSDEERDLYRQYYIKIITVQKGDTIASLSKRMPFKDLKKERFMMLNGLDKGDVLKVGQLLKVITIEKPKK